MIINLYTVRLVFNALGVENYGIYDVVAGVIYMLSSVSSVLSTATQRYYSFSIGEKRFERLRAIFSTSIVLYALLSLIVLILGETLGLWFVNSQLMIPDERMNAANWIYQFSIFSFISTIIQVPYSAAIIAHEDMRIFALISTAECVLKMMSAFFLFVIPMDKLILYGATIFLISILVLISYVIIGSRKYAECRYKKPTEKALFKELLSFSGWSLFGSVAGVGMYQVNTILVNVYFGPLVNSARAISLRINSAICSFTGNFLLAISPPMIKSYAEDSYSYLNKIFNLSNKLIYYGLLMVILPLMFEMNTVLFLWLKTADPQTVLFSRLILVYALIMSLNNPISIVIQATGHVKEYHVPVEAFTLMCVPATYILYKSGYPAYSTYVAMMIAAVAAHIVRLICLKKYFKAFIYSEYIKYFILPAFSITIFASAIIFIIHRSLINLSWRIIIVFVLSIVCVSVFALMIGFTKAEKDFLKQLIAKLKRKVELCNDGIKLK